MRVPEAIHPAIRAVRTITTGHVEQHAEHRHGSSLPRLWWVLTSRSWIKVPVNAYAIEHRDGLVLFDTGADPALASDPKYISSAAEARVWGGRFGIYSSNDALRGHLIPRGGDSLQRKPFSA